MDSEYDPDLIDDPELTTGKHRTVLNLACWRETIIPFVKPKELKEELNEQFKLRHPWLNPTITLHKIRSLKKKLLDIGVQTVFSFIVECNEFRIWKYLPLHFLMFYWINYY
jgi:hypothetical protein